MIKKIFLILLFGLTLCLPTTVLANDYICACFYKNSNGCDSIGANNEIGCGDSCQSNLREEYNNYEYSEVASVMAEIESRCFTAQDSAVSSVQPASVTTITTGAIQLQDGNSTVPFIYPNLSVNIPTVTFSQVLLNDGYVTIDFFGEYAAGLYKYLLGIAAVFAIIMLMIGGVEYIISPEGKNNSKAKTRINKALMGMTILSCVYLILYIVNPGLTTSRGLVIKQIDELILDNSVGTEDITGGARYNSLADLPEKCGSMVQAAQDDTYQACKISGGITSPTVSGAPNCGNHHWGSDGALWDYKNFNDNGAGLDFHGSWGEPIKAPFDGEATYFQRGITGTNRCGNTIYFRTKATDGTRVTLTICHAKDFLGDSGPYLESRKVTRGETIGHIGGRCCDGEDPPSKWDAAKKGWCDQSGPACSDPETSETCNCQPFRQSGNTSDAHVHFTWSGGGGNLLKCLAVGEDEN
ncbi:MAG: hypothetical protein V1664_02605 [Candidatus Uhrbacteria bacterium]